MSTTPLTTLEKLEYIHCVLQDAMDHGPNRDAAYAAIAFLEDIREPYLHEGDD